MRLHRWIKGANQRCEHGGPLCEIEVDGKIATLLYVHDDPPKTIGIYFTYADEGDEINPWGSLIEHSWDGMLVRPQLHYRPQGRRYRYPYPSNRSYPSIFISYRRSDSEAYAGRLHERLISEFGEAEVFMDIFGIRPGETFSCAVQQAAAYCAVMVPVIGRTWPTVTHLRTDRPRLQYSNDFVRREIVAGMDREIPMFPVVMPGGAIPTQADLPEEMRGFEETQMLQLTPRHWRSDVDHLVELIRQALATALPVDPLYHLRANPRWVLK